MTTLFISDLHLEPERPHITELFLRFLAIDAAAADALYILGDLFEAWIGDDEHSDLAKTVAAALKKLSQSGVPIFLMHGNRDFLIGKKFLMRSGCQFLADPSVINLYGTRTLLMHGDTLCTEDTRYLEVRAKYRQPFYRYLFLLLPLFIRKKIAQRLRNASKRHTGQLSYQILDATPAEIIRMMQEHQVGLFIHGHTHRPSLQYFTVGGKMVHRIVLSDWDQTGNVLVCKPDQSRRLINFYEARNQS